MASRRFAAYIDATPVREPRFPCLLNAAVIRVDGARTPDAPTAGFDSSSSADYITVNTGERIRWTDGFAYRPEPCNGGRVIDPWGNVEGTAYTAEAEIDVIPFVVEGVFSRSLFGNPGAGDYDEDRQIALRQLLACRSKQIEAELWKGTLSQASSWGNRYLADSHAVLVEGNRLLGYLTALAALEHAIADGSCSQQGVIHARPDTVSLWDAGGALRRAGNLILTVNDTIVIPGRGYDGSRGGTVPSTDSAWAYATTVPEVLLSNVMPNQSLGERTTTASNDLTTYARQVAAVTWGCLQAAVHVDHTTSITVTGS